MPQDETKVVTETVSESPTKEVTQDSSNEEHIAESKKYRKRAQDAETRLTELEDMLKKQEDTKLKEKEEWKVLYDKATSENESLLEKAKKHDAYESSRRAILMEKHSVEDQEQLKALPLDTLEYVTNKINNIKPNAPETPGHARKEGLDKPNSQLTEKEKKENWANILQQYKPGN